MAQTLHPGLYLVAKLAPPVVAAGRNSSEPHRGGGILPNLPRCIVSDDRHEVGVKAALERLSENVRFQTLFYVLLVCFK